MLPNHVTLPIGTCQWQQFHSCEFIHPNTKPNQIQQHKQCFWRSQIHLPLRIFASTKCGPDTQYTLDRAHHRRGRSRNGKYIEIFTCGNVKYFEINTTWTLFVRLKPLDLPDIQSIRAFIPSCFPGDKAMVMALDCFLARIAISCLFSAEVMASSLMEWVIFCSRRRAVDWTRDMSHGDGFFLR